MWLDLYFIFSQLCNWLKIIITLLHFIIYYYIITFSSIVLFKYLSSTRTVLDKWASSPAFFFVLYNIISHLLNKPYWNCAGSKIKIKNTNQIQIFCENKQRKKNLSSILFLIGAIGGDGDIIIHICLGGEMKAKFQKSNSALCLSFLNSRKGKL